METGKIEFSGVTLLFIFKGQDQTYDVLNLARANLSIIGQFCAENINNVPLEAFQFSDGFYRRPDWTKKRFLNGGLYLLLPRITGEGGLDF